MRGTAPHRIRILSVCPQLTAQGAERQLLHFCRQADPERMEVRVIYYERGDGLRPALEQSGIAVTHVDRQQVGAWGLLKALRREIRQWRPDVLDCRLPSAYRFGRLAALGVGVPVVIAQERTVAKGSAARRLFDRMLNRWTDAWIGNAKAVAEHLIGDLHVAPDRVHVIYNGVDADHFRQAARLPLLEHLRETGHRIVLSLGSLSSSKNQELFLRVCHRLGQEFPDLVFVLCGEGPRRPLLETRAAELALADRCHFLGRQEDVAPVLAAANLLIQTSDYEGLPNAVLEAMAAGVPVVATDAGGTRELITDGVEGFLVPVGGEDDLVARAARLLSDGALAAGFADRARRKAREQFSLEAMSRAYADLLVRLLSEKQVHHGGGAAGRPGRGL